MLIIFKPMISKLFNLNFLLIILISLTIFSCGGKIPGADARKTSPDPRERVKKNLEEGKGFRLNDIGKSSGTTYEFVNIAIFVIGYPVFVLILFSIIYWQYKKIRNLSAKV